MARVMFVLVMLAGCGLTWALPAVENTLKRDITEILPQIEEIVSKGMALSHVPGVAVAIVHNGEIVYVKGFGYRDLEKQIPVTPDTVFQLASVSKPLTATVLAGVVGKGRISWDSKIADLDPSFRLSSPWVTSVLTVRDLLSHRSGLPDHAGDLLEDLGYPRETILHQLRFIDSLHSFREHYAYTNFGFSEAAFAVSKYKAIPWQHLAKETLLDPLGMKATSYAFADYVDHPEKALTYIAAPGGAKLLDPPRQPEAQAPAGGASSSARDMAKWLQLQLGGNKVLHALYQKPLQQTHEPAIFTGMDSKSGYPSFYGMGWSLSFDESGRRYLKHSGDFNLGVRTQVALLPDEKLGIAILTNASPSGLPEAISQSFFDLYLTGAYDHGLVAKYNQLWLQNMVEPQEHFTVEKSSFTQPLPLDDYVGDYSNPYFGALTVRRKGEALELLIGPNKEPYSLTHLTRDVFTFMTAGENAVGETQVIFSFDAFNRVRSLTIDYLNKFGTGTFTPIE